MQLFFLMAGGALGAISRFMIGNIAIHFFGKSNVFTGAAIANCIGGFFAGLILSWLMESSHISQELILFLYIGFISSLTTFSTFVLENVLLVKKGALSQLFAYLFIQIVMVFILTATGIWVGQNLFERI